MNASKLKVSFTLTAVLLAGALTCSACTASPSNPRDTTGCTGTQSNCPKQALKLVPPYTSGSIDAKEIWPNHNQLINDAAKRSQKKAMAGLVQKDGRDTFRTTLGGSYFYVTPNWYLVWPKGVTPKGPSAKDHAYCEFYLYNSQMQFVSSHIAKVGVGPHNTLCNDVAGVSGVAFHGKPALLAIVQYFYPGRHIAHSVAQIGANWIRTTVLMPLVQQPNGKWVFTQDSTCFAPTNTISTLAKAKAHLATCK